MDLEARARALLVSAYGDAERAGSALEGHDSSGCRACVGHDAGCLDRCSLAAKLERALERVYVLTLLLR